MHRNLIRLMGFALVCMLLWGGVATAADTDDSFFEMLGVEAPVATATPEAIDTPVPQATQPPVTEPPVLAQADPAQENEGLAAVAPQELAMAEPVATEWTYPIPTEILTSDTEFLLLVNKEYLLDSKFKPDDLEDVKVRKSKNIEIQLRKEAHEALLTMFDDASTQGITLYALSGYRSYQTQAVMYENVGKDSTLVQAPGASDHQTGLGVDVISKKVIGQNLNRSFEAEKEAQWMAEHCWEYGFVIRYPKGKEDITGISYEPWHLRYVGSIDVAAYLSLNDLTLEEFTIEWQSEMMQYDSAFVPTSISSDS